MGEEQARRLKRPIYPLPDFIQSALLKHGLVEAYVGKTITSPLLTHNIASSLSLMRTGIPFFSDAYPCPNSKLTHKLARKSCTEQIPTFAPRNEISCLIRARNCVKVATKCVTTLFLAQELGIIRKRKYKEDVLYCFVPECWAISS